MPKLIALLLCFLSFAASAQDVKLTFGGSTLSRRETNFTTTAQLQKDLKLKVGTDGYKVVSYVISTLPKQGDLIGPFTVIPPTELPQLQRNIISRTGGSRIFLDSILLQGPDGKKFKHNSYIVVCQ